MHAPLSRLRVARASIALVAAVFLGGALACRKGGSDQKPAPRADVRIPPADAPPPPSNPDAASVGVPADAAVTAAPPATESDWVPGGLYNFRLAGVERCG